MEGRKRCPQCGEEVDVSADVCRFCRHGFEGGRKWRRGQNWRLLGWVILAVLIVLVVFAVAYVADGDRQAISPAAMARSRSALSFATCATTSSDGATCS
jgi:predicted nucleic acid-binding Zn ribbon protein